MSNILTLTYLTANESVANNLKTHYDSAVANVATESVPPAPSGHIEAKVVADSTNWRLNAETWFATPQDMKIIVDDTNAQLAVSEFKDPLEYRVVSRSTV